jgi:hypothetical protein
MIQAGEKSQVQWVDDNWIFLDIGFSSAKSTCGLLFGNEHHPSKLQFGEAQKRIITKIKDSKSLVNLVIEAPLSVCFAVSGNPTGRWIEKEDEKCRYWYVGAGCAVMVAATYLVRKICDAKPAVPIRLFEGFVSYKNRDTKSDHAYDVKLLREVVQEHEAFASCIFSADQLKQKPDDELVSAFEIIGLKCGIPAVIKPTINVKTKSA